MSDHEDVASRLREFGKNKFGTLAGLAKALGMKPQSLQAYLNGTRLPGRRMVAKLEAIGCSMIWLLTGKFPGEHQEGEFAKWLVRTAQARGLSVVKEAISSYVTKEGKILERKDNPETRELVLEDAKMVARLKEWGIDTDEKLANFLNIEDFAKDVVRVVAERMERYKIKKKKGGKNYGE